MLSKRHFCQACFAGIATMITSRSYAQTKTPPSWNYETLGPTHWSSIDSSFRACQAGDQQSPIDLHATLKAEIPSLSATFAKAGSYQIWNNGHTLQINDSHGSQLKVGDLSYDLVQFHFHTPSEHTVDEKPTDMEVHFVYQGPQSRIAVLAAFLVAGKANAPFARIMAVAEPIENSKPNASFDPRPLLPDDLARTWRYEGSLTTPPCTQSVDWIICENQVSVASSDIVKFRKIFPHNARPIQPLNRRYVLHD
jgi:carbonic anhydrase